MAAGCSAQVSRFGGGVDDLFTASTPNQQQIINQQPAQNYPGDQQVAAAPIGGSNSGSVSRGSLSPVSTQPLPAPSATAMAAAPVSAPAPARIEQAAAPATSAQPRMVLVNSEADSKPTKVADANTSGKKPGVPADKAPATTDKVAVLPQQPKARDSAATAQLDTSSDTKAKPTGTAGTYKVQEGDTLNRIASKTGVGVAALKEANGLQDGLIRIGQTLKLPSGAAPVATASAAAAKPVAKATVDPVVTSTTGAAKAAAPTETVAAYTPPKKSDKLIQQAEQEPASAPNATGISRMRWPVRGRVISSYSKGGGKANDGIDIAVPEGTPVKAAENGVVIYAGDGLKEFGNTVLVRHENGLVTVYGHASELKVQRGQKVKRGEELALSGMSGTTDAPKLHFEVRKNSAPVDPSGFLE